MELLRAGRASLMIDVKHTLHGLAVRRAHRHLNMATAIKLKRNGPWLVRLASTVVDPKVLRLTGVSTKLALHPRASLHALKLSIG